MEIQVKSMKLVAKLINTLKHRWKREAFNWNLSSAAIYDCSITCDWSKLIKLCLIFICHTSLISEKIRLFFSLWSETIDDRIKKKSTHIIFGHATVTQYSQKQWKNRFSHICFAIVIGLFGFPWEIFNEGNR